MVSPAEIYTSNITQTRHIIFMNEYIHTHAYSIKVSEKLFMGEFGGSKRNAEI